MMSEQLLGWEPTGSIIHKEMTVEAKYQRLLDYVTGLYQQFQIDPDQYRTLIRLIEDTNKENN